MQPRRRKCVRPPAPQHFLKALLPSPIHANQLRIPEEFITRFGTEISTDNVTISVPDGRTWEMGLKKCEGRVYFCNNWQEFVKYYSICYGSYLVFKYEGNSNFSVVIFDSTSTEIHYPLNKMSSFETTIDAGLASSRMSKSVSSVETTIDTGLASSRMSKSASERAQAAANAFKPKNPYFLSTIKPQYLYVSTDFASKYLKPKVPVKLQNSNGDKWQVSCLLNRAGSLSMRMTRGLVKFAKDNDLSEGDTCVFELIKRRHPVVLQVSTFRAVDYAN